MEGVCAHDNDDDAIYEHRVSHRCWAGKLMGTKAVLGVECGISGSGRRGWQGLGCDLDLDHGYPLLYGGAVDCDATYYEVLVMLSAFSLT